MKQRIKIDSMMMVIAIVLSIVLFFFPSLYSRSIVWDDATDFLGLLLILKGVYLRMVARGYKKEYSQKGRGLVTAGPYTLTRNPMYLGTYFMGAGFLLVLWPWWLLIVYTIVFLKRFNVQIEKEEAHLQALFGQAYEDFCAKVPRFFPRISSLLKIRVAKIFPWGLCWNTSERLGLIFWPMVAIGLDLVQERLVFGLGDPRRIIYLACVAGVLFAMSLLYHYRIRT